MSARVQDYALIVGHVWRCPTCREALLTQPETTWMGYKLSEEQRERLRQLDEESFQTLMRLSECTGLSPQELESAIEHPRARLRHLGSTRGEYFFRPNSGTRS
ncbi:hypothetical protein FKZ61_019340 [Litorilinea aerophila]|uniref:Uncharacterized protein n=1 Tax=Litorilinea aerophila TaxID=1204385 RepID=A0A540VAS8_9CHLR|nr:hypothetical protein [Litorilinea aerophila]MCC9078257.1 hypothetical protein [Litorilinea aerophila]OUC08391.1 hypothetical protein RY27_09280 [Litorilinea aerophila]GIV77477.1 MAG: hypothetical protein KatS3mg050_1871 [Litorilinea sp.]